MAERRLFCGLRLEVPGWKLEDCSHQLLSYLERQRHRLDIVPPSEIMRS